MSKTKPAYVGQPEVSSVGVQKKGTGGPAAKPRVTVHQKTERRGKHWLRNFVAGMLIADMTWGLLGISEYFSSPEEVETKIHAMWLFGSAHAAAVAAVLMNKWE